MLRASASTASGSFPLRTWLAAGVADAVADGMRLSLSFSMSATVGGVFVPGGDMSFGVWTWSSEGLWLLFDLWTWSIEGLWLFVLSANKGLTSAERVLMVRG